jgi:protein-S-isoprenylcysteine O-methyltransferase Ste14
MNGAGSSEKTTASRTGNPNMKNQNGFWERGGIWVVCQTVLLSGMVVLSLAYRAESRHLGLFLLGIAFLVFGAGFCLAGALAMRKNLTPFPKPLPQAQLVRHGIYAHVRHPIYTSVLFGAIGWSLLWQSRLAFIIALSLIPFFTAKARREEHWLRNRFPEYAVYAEDTWRFLPWIF